MYVNFQNTQYLAPERKPYEKESEKGYIRKVPPLQIIHIALVTDDSLALSEQDHSASPARDLMFCFDYPDDRRQHHFSPCPKKMERPRPLHTYDNFGCRLYESACN